MSGHILDLCWLGVEISGGLSGMWCGTFGPNEIWEISHMTKELFTFSSRTLLHGVLLPSKSLHTHNY